MRLIVEVLQNEAKKNIQSKDEEKKEVSNLKEKEVLLYSRM